MQEIVYHTNYQLETSYWWFVARNKIIYSLLKKYCPINNNANLLDVGCGTGGFASFISNYIDVICLDTSELALSYCKKRGLSNLFFGTIADFNKKNIKMQFITMLDVVEHIANDREVLRQAFEALQNNGYLIATVPAYNWLWSRHDEIHMHQRRYNKKQFVELITTSGFEIVFSSYFNSFLFPLVAIKRLIERFLKNKKDSSSPVEKVSPLSNKILEKIFAFERIILKFIKFPFGLSIIVIAKK